MLSKLYKMAYSLDKRGFYNEAAEIEKVMEVMAKRVGLKIEEMVSLADYFDEAGETELADQFDSMAKEAAKKKTKGKGGDKSPPNKRPKPPKHWLEKMLGEVMPGVKKRFPEVSEKEAKRRAVEVVSDIWHNELSDAKIENILKKKAETDPLAVLKTKQMKDPAQNKIVSIYDYMKNNGVKDTEMLSTVSKMYGVTKPETWNMNNLTKHIQEQKMSKDLMSGKDKLKTVPLTQLKDVGEHTIE